MPTKGKISQQKIAKSLGVSQALVSLALNGRHDTINPETYKRIWDYAVASGYSPKGMNLDQVMAGARPKQVGFILRAPLKLYNASNFFSHVQHGLHVALEARGFTSVFLGTEDNLTGEKLAHLLRTAHGCEGVVLLGQVSRAFLQTLRNHTQNIVAVSACFPGVCHSVQSNEQQSLGLLMTHLISLGHRRIGWLGGNRGMFRHEQRFGAFRQALQDHGLPALEAYWNVQEGGDRVEGAQAAREILRLRDRPDFPTAFIVYNGLMARGAINTLLQQQVVVPADLSVAAVDATRVMEEDEPAITSASANPEALGEAAARLLLDNPHVEGSYTDLVMSSSLTVRATTGRARESTAPAPGKR
ncbi:MAG: malI [Rariglobus sp.]|jgi:LacI family transcriptional regulator|nr:malI [Rariglobus sp.]